MTARHGEGRPRNEGAREIARRRAVTFYASPQVFEWIESLESGEKSKRINELLLANPNARKAKTLEGFLDFCSNKSMEVDGAITIRLLVAYIVDPG